MNIDDYKSKEQIQAAIERREKSLEKVRWRKDEHFKDWHFEAGKEYRAIEKNIARLRAKLRRMVAPSAEEE